MTKLNWQAAGLAKPSVFKPLIATIEKERIINVMGQLTDKDQQGAYSGDSDHPFGFYSITHISNA
ncbi:MAG: hypothetical protein KTR20_04150 [Cellvibrionaceae bacterium]|nr:hypothetical protein [Cellvibrionaceae bacterium]